MTIYWMMFIFPTILALMPWKATSYLARLAWLTMSIILILIIGLRFEVGGDWLSYLVKFREVYGKDLSDVVNIHNDPGYWFFNWLFANIDLEIWALNLLCALLSVSGIIAIAKRQPQPWVAVAVAVPYILVVVSMGYVRQAVALGLVCWALLAIQDRRPWRFLMLIFAAAAFHKSAVVAMPLYLFTLPRIRFRHWVMLAAMLVSIIAVLVAETFDTQWHNYIEQQKESEGALIRVMMNLPPALLLLLWERKLGLGDSRLRHWYWIAWVSLALVLMVNYASTAIDRLALYLLPIQMVVYSRVYLLPNDRLFRSVLPFSVLLLYAAVLFVWLNFANHADSWVPYQFYPLVGVF